MPSATTIQRRALQLGLTVTALLLAGLGMTAAKLVEAYAAMRRWDRELGR